MENGLDVKEVEKARTEEVEFLKTKGILELVDYGECERRTGRKPVSVRWVDVNKGDDLKTNYRSRLEALIEQKNSNNAH